MLQYRTFQGSKAQIVYITRGNILLTMRLHHRAKTVLAREHNQLYVDLSIKLVDMESTGQ